MSTVASSYSHLLNLEVSSERHPYESPGRPPVGKQWTTNGGFSLELLELDDLLDPELFLESPAGAEAPAFLNHFKGFREGVRSLCSSSGVTDSFWVGGGGLRPLELGCRSASIANFELTRYDPACSSSSSRSFKLLNPKHRINLPGTRFYRILKTKNKHTPIPSTCCTLKN